MNQSPQSQTQPSIERWRTWHQTDQDALRLWLKKQIQKTKLQRSLTHLHPHVQVLLDSLHPKQHLVFDSPAQQILFGGAAGPGKQLDIETPISTPDGFKKMGDILPGDQVMGGDGLPVRVIAVSEIDPNPECYAVTFDTGETIYADARHLWVTLTDVERMAVQRRTDTFRDKRRASRPSRAVALSKNPGVSVSVTALNKSRQYAYLTSPCGTIRTTEEIAKTLIIRGRVTHSIMVAPALVLPGSDLPLDPFTFGLWLGDGASHDGLVGMMEEDLTSLLPFIPYPVTWRRVDMRPPRKTPFLTIRLGGVKTLLRDLGVLKNKHIPSMYLRASYTQRVALLQGILDTDGHAASDGTIELGLSNQRLAEDCLELVSSLGIKATLKRKKTTAKDSYRMIFLAPFPAFRLLRKAVRQKVNNFRPTVGRRYIVDVAPAPPRPMRCIQVDALDGLYLVGRTMIPTHNSYLLRVAAIAWALRIPRLQVYLFRRKFPDLYANHMEGPSSFPELLRPLVAAGLAKINYSNHEMTFANGSHIRLAHMQFEKDKENIQGAEIHLALIDELTHFTKTQYAFIRSRVRMVGVEVPPAYAGLFPRLICGSNPGSMGHNWVKALFIDPAPDEAIWTAPPDEGGLSTQFIPAFLHDNPSMMAQDPDYALRLQGLDNAALVKAMMEGDWNIVAGGLLDDLFVPAIHVLEPFTIPPSWPLYRSMDWGSSHPFSVAWWARSDGTETPDGRHYPRGSVFRLQEWYGWNGKPNEGLRMLAVEVGRGIVGKEKEMGIWGRVQAGPADAAMWKAENGVCIIDDVHRGGVRFVPSDSSPGSRKSGAEALRKYLKAALQSPREDPGLFIFSTCRHWIRTVPVLPRDPYNPDDADSDAEDHCYDESRYFLMTRRSDRTSAAVQGV